MLEILFTGQLILIAITTGHLAMSVAKYPRIFLCQILSQALHNPLLKFVLCFHRFFSQAVPKSHSSKYLEIFLPFSVSFFMATYFFPHPSLIHLPRATWKQVIFIFSHIIVTFSLRKRFSWTFLCSHLLLHPELQALFYMNVSLAQTSMVLIVPHPSASIFVGSP